MSIIRKLIVAVFIITATQCGAQNLSEIFAKSYAAEKNLNFAEAITAMQGQTYAGSYEVNLRLGWLYYSDKKYVESVNYYQKAIALKPSSTEPLWGIIYPLSAQEKWNLVEQIYKDIIKLDPGNSKANYYLGSIYFYRKDYNNAKKYLLNVVTLYPFDHDSSLLLAWSYYYLGNMAEAKSTFYHVLNNKPDDSSAKQGLALIK